MKISLPNLNIESEIYKKNLTKGTVIIIITLRLSCYDIFFNNK